jgi:hypothetical protein
MNSDSSLKAEWTTDATVPIFVVLGLMSLVVIAIGFSKIKRHDS